MPAPYAGPVTVEEARTLLAAEIRQRREEGCEIREFEGRTEEVRDLPAAEALYAGLSALRSPSESSEPSTLPAIRAARPDGPRQMGRVPQQRLRDRLLGAWLGRCAGCQLGKPVEGWPRERIRQYLEGAGEWPLAGYIPERSRDAEGKEWRAPSPDSTRERLRCAARDDDQDYTLLALAVLEKRGSGFTTREVGEAWLDSLPYYKVYTAERLAYRNLVQGLQPPETALRWNPYREWIGAQIRADGWGYAAPGRPELAAGFAFRDASLSHVKNGIYGEMFFAAAIAAGLAMEEPDIEACLRIALSEIPARSRFAAMVEDLLQLPSRAATWESAWEQVHARYGGYDWVHTINNAALVILGLLYGKGDFGRTVCHAVEGGWDTDCNGATAGSLMGAMLGASRLPETWIQPLNDTLESGVFGFAECRISDLADRTLVVARRNGEA